MKTANSNIKKKKANTKKNTKIIKVKNKIKLSSNPVVKKYLMILLIRLMVQNSVTMVGFLINF